MNEYLYIDTGGKEQKVTAGSSADATRLAKNRAATSGVMLLTPTKTGATDPVKASSLNPATSPTLPTPKADDVQAGYIGSLADNVTKARSNLEKSYKTQKEEADRKITKLEKEEKAIVDKAEPLTDPFREKLETTERERLYVNENFEKNQKLTNELDTLLTEGNNLIRYNQGLPVSQRISGARSDKAIQDVAARAGVIEAVMSARNSQIGQAYNMIDRSVAAITADRSDKLAYYDTLLTLNGNKQLKLSAESKAIAEEQRNLMKGDLERAEKTADYIKELMISPQHAQLVADAGVTLNDTVEEINTKLATATKQQEIVDTTNDLVAKGYTPVLAPGAGIVEFEVGGKKIYFREPPEKPKGGSSSSIKSVSETELNNFEASYGWRPPAGVGIAEALQYMRDNPGVPPEKLQRELTAAMSGQEVPKISVAEATDSIISEATDEQIKALKLKADAAGLSSWWTNKKSDVERFIKSAEVQNLIQIGIDEGYSVSEIIDILSQ